MQKPPVSKQLLVVPIASRQRTTGRAGKISRARRSQLIARAHFLATLPQSVPLLRTRGEQPSGRRSAQGLDELVSSHVTPPRAFSLRGGVVTRGVPLLKIGPKSLRMLRTGGYAKSDDLAELGSGLRARRLSGWRQPHFTRGVRASLTSSLFAGSAPPCL
jgi:hypothetical protein